MKQRRRNQDRLRRKHVIANNQNVEDGKFCLKGGKKGNTTSLRHARNRLIAQKIHPQSRSVCRIMDTNNSMLPHHHHHHLPNPTYAHQHNLFDTVCWCWRLEPAYLQSVNLADTMIPLYYVYLLAPYDGMHWIPRSRETIKCRERWSETSLRLVGSSLHLGYGDNDLIILP